MPEHDYGFAPAAGMRTLGEQLKHLATVVHLTTGTMRQAQSLYAPGEGNNGPGEIQSKESILNYLAEAFAAARSTIAGVTDASALELIPTYFGPQTRAQLASGVLQHSYNHYGQLVVYARLRGVAPPFG